MDLSHQTIKLRLLQNVSESCFPATEHPAKDVETNLGTKFLAEAFDYSSGSDRLELLGVERIMGSRHTFFTFPLFQDLLFVEDQGIAVAIQHGLGAIDY